MFSTHDFRLPENGAPVCAACYRTAAGPRETACPGSTTVHVGNPALCGSPEGEHGGQPNCILCIAIVEAAPQAPEHDFRIGDGIVACARCGCADADILEFRHCFFRRGRAAHRNDADAWHVVSSPHRALCGEPGEFGWWRRASGDKPATCRSCLDAIRALPPIRAVHDPRLVHDWTVCATCGLAAATIAGLGSACDGGVFIETFVRIRRDGGRTVNRRFAEAESMRRYTGSGWARHMPGCPHFQTGFRDGGRTAWRVACLPCLRRLAQAPAVPAP